MFGVAFTQSCEDALFGILLFDKEDKAKSVYKILSSMKELDSLDPNLQEVLDSSDYDEVPECEDIEEVIEICVGGEAEIVRVVNVDDIPDLDSW